MKENSIFENDSCLNIENLEIFKNYISKNGFSPSSVGPPYPVIIYSIPNDTIGHNFKYSRIYNKNKELVMEEIHISNTENDFSYCIKIENDKIKLEYEKFENHSMDIKLREKYQDHFCELMKNMNN